MMSKAELARKAGLSTLTIDRVEAGRPCRLDTKRKILIALGMMMFSPTVVSVPLKLLVFVLLDGWSKLVHGLILTYA